ncbi:hypothetical protein ES708_14729 [subsurface metagenome]
MKKRGRWERRLICPWCFVDYSDGGVKSEFNVEKRCRDCGKEITEKVKGIIIRVNRRY